MGTIVTTPMYLLLYPSTDDFPPIPNVIVQFVAGTILGHQLQGTPPQDMRVAALMNWPVALTGMLLVFWVALPAVAAGRDSECQEAVTNCCILPSNNIRTDRAVPNAPPMRPRRACERITSGIMAGIRRSEGGGGCAVAIFLERWQLCNRHRQIRSK